MQPGNLAKIDHIVVLMMENRSFDHMVGYLSLPGGRSSGKPVNGLRGGEVNHFRGQDFPSHLLDKTFIPFSPCHGFLCTQHQVSDNMGGFVASFAEHDEDLGADISLVMGHYDGKLLPVYDQLAAQFALCDRWHAAHPGPTWPNRFITVSGHLNKDTFDQFEFDNPNLGAFAPSLADTIFDVLSANGVSWRYYENGYSFARLFARHTFDVKNVLGFSSFLKDAAAGALPSVSFIDPDFIEFPPGADDQAPSDPIDGQRFVGTVVNALLASPSWAKTLLIVTYDEHGGFYDHVPPPPPRSSSKQTWIVTDCASPHSWSHPSWNRVMCLASCSTTRPSKPRFNGVFWDRKRPTSVRESQMQPMWGPPSAAPRPVPDCPRLPCRRKAPTGAASARPPSRFRRSRARSSTTCFSWHGCSPESAPSSYRRIDQAASKKLRKSDSAISGRPGATLNSLPARIHRSSSSTSPNRWSNESTMNKQRLVVIDLGALVDDPLQLQRIALHFVRFDRSAPVRRTNSAGRCRKRRSRSARAAHQAEFHGEPEEARHARG